MMQVIPWWTVTVKRTVGAAVTFRVAEKHLANVQQLVAKLDFGEVESVTIEAEPKRDD